MSKRSLILIFTVAVLTVAAYALAIYGVYAGRVIHVPSGSMSNTIIPGDVVLARRFSREVKRGEPFVIYYSTAQGSGEFRWDRVFKSIQ